MKLNNDPRTTLAITLTAIASLLGGSLLAAEEGGKRRGARRPAIEKHDTDKDGKLSKEERDAAKAAMKALHAAADTNGDGKVSPPERLAAFKKRLSQDKDLAAKALARFDADENGELSDEELEKAAKRGRRDAAKRRPAGKGEKGRRGGNRKGKRGGKKSAE